VESGAGVRPREPEITVIACHDHPSARRARVCHVLSRSTQVVEGVTLAQLLALADGTLPPERRAAVEERVTRSPRATEMLRAQRRAVAAIQAFSPPAPPGLALRLRAPVAPRRPALSRAGPAFAAACVALALAVTLTADRGLTVAWLAQLSERPATQPAGGEGARAGLLRRSFAGVTFPDWEESQDWRVIGARRDTVDGRATDTVYYRRTHHTVGYTVLSGPSLGLPKRGRRVERDAVAVQLYRDGPATIAVFERGGRTCVLAGVVHRPETLVRLAAWRADGALTF
jgi:anti-sigma factor RsiW